MLASTQPSEPRNPITPPEDEPKDATNPQKAKRTCGVRLHSTSTGNVRPGMLKTGALPKKAENLLASRVADVTMSLKSARRATT